SCRLHEGVRTAKRLVTLRLFLLSLPALPQSRWAKACKPLGAQPFRVTIACLRSKIPPVSPGHLNHLGCRRSCRAFVIHSEPDRCGHSYSSGGLWHHDLPAPIGNPPRAPVASGRCLVFPIWPMADDWDLDERVGGGPSEAPRVYRRGRGSAQPGAHGVLVRPAR